MLGRWEKHNLRIRTKAKWAYFDDLMLILNFCFIAFFRWDLKALCFQFFFSKGRGNSCVSTIFLEEADCQGLMGEAEGGKGVKKRKIKAPVHI